MIRCILFALQGHLLQESVKRRMRVGVLGDLEEWLEEVVEDLLEVVDQLVALVDVVQTRNLE